MAGIISSPLHRRAGSVFASIAWAGRTFRVEDIPSLDKALNDIEQEVDPRLPQGISIERSNGDTLMVVLGASVSVATYIAKSGDPPYFNSLGDPNAKGVITFYVDGDHHSEAEAWCGISPPEARQAVREFVNMTGGLPKCITWCMV
jgi:hypothetical protein